MREVRRIDNGRLDIPGYFSITCIPAREVRGQLETDGHGQHPWAVPDRPGERFSFFSYIKNQDNFITSTYPEFLAAGYNLPPPQ